MPEDSWVSHLWQIQEKGMKENSCTTLSPRARPALKLFPDDNVTMLTMSPCALSTQVRRGELFLFCPACCRTFVRLPHPHPCLPSHIQSSQSLLPKLLSVIALCWCPTLQGMRHRLSVPIHSRRMYLDQCGEQNQSA